MDDVIDERLLRRTFGLARLAKNRGNGAFGAILARKSGVVLFEAENTVTEDHGDPTAHAEMNLLREASVHFDPSELADLTMYCSTEPCAMCAAAAYYCGVGRIVYGLPSARYRENKGRGLALGCQELLELGPDHKVAIVGPLLEAEAAQVHGFGEGS